MRENILPFQNTYKKVSFFCFHRKVRHKISRENIKLILSLHLSFKSNRTDACDPALLSLDKDCFFCFLPSIKVLSPKTVFFFQDDFFYLFGVHLASQITKYLLLYKSTNLLMYIYLMLFLFEVGTLFSFSISYI